MKRTDYLEKILTARVYDVAIESPLETAPNLPARIGTRLLLKREDMQPVFSFKLRGAYNKMSALPESAQARRDRGQCGQPCAGVALAAQKLRLPRGDRDAGDRATHQDRRGQRCAAQRSC